MTEKAAIKLTVNVWQRLTLVQVLGEVRGNAATIRKVLGLLDIFELTEEEKAEVGYKINADGAVLWEHNCTYDMEVTGKVEGDILCKSVKNYQAWPVKKSEEIFALFSQLGIE